MRFLESLDFLQSVAIMLWFREQQAFATESFFFNVFGCVSKQNMRYWCGVNPCELHQKPLSCERVTVWCAMSVMGIIDPYFFEENNPQLP